MLLRSKLSLRYLLRFLALNIFQSAPGVGEEVNRIVKRVYDRAVSLLMEHRETLDRIARALHLICIARLRAEGEGSPAVVSTVGELLRLCLFFVRMRFTGAQPRYMVVLDMQDVP
jgi:hypothetical protein